MSHLHTVDTSLPVTSWMPSTCPSAHPQVTLSDNGDNEGALDGEAQRACWGRATESFVPRPMVSRGPALAAPLAIRSTLVVTVCGWARRSGTSRISNDERVCVKFCACNDRGNQVGVPFGGIQPSSVRVLFKRLDTIMLRQSDTDSVRSNVSTMKPAVMNMQQHATRAPVSTPACRVLAPMVAARTWCSVQLRLTRIGILVPYRWESLPTRCVLAPPR